MEKAEAETEQDKTRLKAESSEELSRREISVSSNPRRRSQPPQRPNHSPAVDSDDAR